MKNTAVILTFLVLATACQSSDPGGEQKEFLTDAPAETDSTEIFYAAFTEENSRLLEKYFEPSVLTKLDQYVLAYNSMATDAEFEKNYNDGMALFADLYEALTVPKTDYLIDRMEEMRGEDEYFYPVDLLDEYQELNGVLGPIEISCAAECTDLDFLFDLTAMLEKAKSTKGKGDDDFIELVMHIEGQYGYASYPGFKVWFVQTWDYGGYSLLGNGDFTDAVHRAQQYEKKHRLFAPQLKSMHEDFVNALGWESNFGLDKETVLKELDGLLEMDYFTDEDRVKMKETSDKIQSEAEGYQFGCETGDCAYG